jgi:hypothetical protein
MNADDTSNDSLEMKTVMMHQQRMLDQAAQQIVIDSINTTILLVSTSEL